MQEKNEYDFKQTNEHEPKNYPFYCSLLTRHELKLSNVSASVATWAAQLKGNEKMSEKMTKLISNFIRNQFCVFLVYQVANNKKRTKTIEKQFQKCIEINVVFF